MKERTLFSLFYAVEPGLYNEASVKQFERRARDGAKMNESENGEEISASDQGRSGADLNEIATQSRIHGSEQARKESNNPPHTITHLPHPQSNFKKNKISNFT